MTALVDTSALIAFYDSRSSHHEAVIKAFQATPAPLSVSPLVLAEFDYLITKYAGTTTAVRALREIATTVHIEEFGANDLRTATQVMEDYAGLDLGLTDASIVVLAQRCRTSTVLTLDRRHFLAVRPLSRFDTFTLLPD